MSRPYLLKHLSAPGTAQGWHKEPGFCMQLPVGGRSKVGEKFQAARCIPGHDSVFTGYFELG